MFHNMNHHSKNESTFVIYNKKYHAQEKSELGGEKCGRSGAYAGGRTGGADIPESGRMGGDAIHDSGCTGGVDVKEYGSEAE